MSGSRNKNQNGVRSVSAGSGIREAQQLADFILNLAQEAEMEMYQANLAHEKAKQKKWMMDEMVRTMGRFLNAQDAGLV